MSKYIEGAEYILRTSMGDTTVVCNKVYGNDTVSFFQYKKRGAKSPIARYRMDTDGNIKGFNDLTIVPVNDAPIVKTKSKSTSTTSDIEKHKHKNVIMKSWKNNVASGWYRGFANMNKDSIHNELMFLFLIKRTLESSDD